MSTNYYWKGNNCSVCKHSKGIHIGKQSQGWPFQWRGYRVDGEGLGIYSVKDWENVIKVFGGIIVDEYGEEYNPDRFFKAARKWYKTETHKFTDWVDLKMDSEGYVFFYYEFC